MSGGDFQTLKLDFDGDVATISLNRPERLNAINYTMIEEIGLAHDAAMAGGARALVLRGEGRAFTSGGDLAGEGVRADDIAVPLEKLYNPVVEKLFDSPVPIIAAVQGAAAGAGCALALCADLIVAETSAYFVLSFVNIGLVPDAGATWILTRQVGRARATEMMLLGERIDAGKALDWGLIYQVVDDGTATDVAKALAQRLAAGPTASIGYLRKSIRAALDGNLTASLAAERDMQGLAGRTTDFREAIVAFQEKRKPVFVGK